MSIRRVPKSSKGEETWKRIYDSAQKLFLNQGYHKTSILAISRDSGVSPATIYQYFESKDNIFEIILESFQEEFFNLIKDALSMRVSLDEKISYMVNSFFDSIWKYKSEFKVYREAEFIDRNLAARFHQILSDSLKNTFPMNNDLYPPVTLWFLIGPLMYIGTFWVLWNETEVPENVREVLKDFYVNGISKGEFKVDLNVYRILDKYSRIEEEPETKGERTRKTLLKSAELLFGRNGFNNTSIHEIVSMSECSVGAFYIYFKSKKDILMTLVDDTNKSLRHFMKICTAEIKDRRNIEIASYMAFLDFFRRHRNIYAIVREAEFVDKKISLEYYEKLQKAYFVPLEISIKNNEIRNMDIKSLAFILMGIGHLLGHSLLILGETSKEDFRKYIDPLSELIFYGLNITEKGRGSIK